MHTNETVGENLIKNLTWFIEQKEFENKLKSEKQQILATILPEVITC